MERSTVGWISVYIAIVIVFIIHANRSNPVPKAITTPIMAYYPDPVPASGMTAYSNPSVDIMCTSNVATTSINGWTTVTVPMVTSGTTVGGSTETVPVRSWPLNTNNDITPSPTITPPGPNP